MVLGTRCSFGLFYAAILREYGWGRAEAAGAFSLMMIIHSLMAPLTGILIDRLGPRKLFPLGATILGIGLAASALISKMWHLYVFFGVISAIGANPLSYAPHISRVPRWFDRKMGLASGLVLSGTGIGALVLALLSGFMIETWGWRRAFFILGVLIFVVIVPMTALFQRRSPEDVGQSLESIEPAADNPIISEVEHGDKKLWTFRAAFGTIPFWSLNTIGFFQGFFINTIVVHLAVFILDRGLSPMFAASSVGVVGLLGSLGGIFFGILSDRAGRESGYFWGSGVAILGVLFLLFVKDSSSVLLLYAFVVLYGVGHGGIISIIAAATGDLFPGNALGKIISFQATTFGLGAALGAYLGGLFYDRTGSYTAPFIIVLVLIIVSAAALWIAAPRKNHLRPFQQGPGESKEH